MFSVVANVYYSYELSLMVKHFFYEIHCIFKKNKNNGILARVLFIVLF